MCSVCDPLTVLQDSLTLATSYRPGFIEVWKADGSAQLAFVAAFGALRRAPGAQGVRLTPNSYSPTAMPAQEIASLSVAGAPGGFQMHLAQDKLSGTLDLTLTNGINLKGRFIEVYDSDCKNPTESAAVHAANTKLFGLYAH
jgi:hypothetical protein